MNNTKKKTIVIVVVSLAVVAITAISGVLLYSLYKDYLSFTSSNNTVNETVSHEEERFATEIEFEYFDNSVDFVEYIEEQIQYEFPDVYYEDDLLATTEDYYAVTDLSQHELIAEYFYVIHLDDLDSDELEELEKQIAEDDRFIETLGDLKVLIGSPGGTNLDEYKMVYNMDTKEFNTMPDKAGEYSLITVFYDADLRCFSINRFNNKYWKLER